jgi:hypothetical protein
MNENAIGKEVVDAAVQEHRELGSGLLETVHKVVAFASWRLGVRRKPKPNNRTETNPAITLRLQSGTNWRRVVYPTR